MIWSAESRVSEGILIDCGVWQPEHAALSVAARVNCVSLSGAVFVICAALGAHAMRINAAPPIQIIDFVFVKIVYTLRS